MKSKAWKTMILLTAVSLLALSVRAAAAGDSRVSLLMVSDWAYQVIPEGSDGTWLGIFKTAGGSELKSTRVHIKSSEEPDARKAVVDSEDTPLFLVRGLRNAQPGVLPTAKVLGSEDPGPGQRVTLAFRGTESSLFLRANPGEEEAYDLVFESGQRRQVLYESYGRNEGRIQVIWAGDLDHDGRLDFVVDYAEDDAGSAPTLFLSSQAKPGELVGEAADFPQYCC
jgi:hypothetical protein